jgi:hypothetical protein
MIWLSLIAVFTIQEITSTAAVLLLAKNAGLNIWLIHLLFLATTILETALGFWLAQLIKQKFPHSRVAAWSKKLSSRWQLKRSKGTVWLLIGLGFLSLTWSVAFIGVWLEIPFTTILLWTTVGDIVWYGMEWGIALGVSWFAPNLVTSLVYIVVIGITLTIVFISFRKKAGMVR